MHVRSLQGTVFQFPTQDGRRLSQGSEHGDMVLEDTGSIGMTCMLLSVKWYLLKHIFSWEGVDQEFIEWDAIMGESNFYAH